MMDLLKPDPLADAAAGLPVLAILHADREGEDVRVEFASTLQDAAQLVEVWSSSADLLQVRPTAQYIALNSTTVPVLIDPARWYCAMKVDGSGEPLSGAQLWTTLCSADSVLDLPMRQPTDADLAALPPPALEILQGTSVAVVGGALITALVVVSPSMEALLSFALLRDLVPIPVVVLAPDPAALPSRILDCLLPI